MQGAQVQSLVRELDPAYMLQLRSPHAETKRSRIPQLKIPHAATKILHAATKGWRSLNKYLKKDKKKKKKQKSWKKPEGGKIPYL